MLAARVTRPAAATVRRLAESGPQTSAALQHTADPGSPGRPLHHLKALTSADHVERDAGRTGRTRRPRSRR